MLRNRFLTLGSIWMLLVSAAIAADREAALKSSGLISPAQLNSELSAVKAGKIVLIQVGFLTMYKMGHIPGSQYAGPAVSGDGMAKLKTLVATLPHNQQIVIYCGCCPSKDCPNIHPAFRALAEKGFTNVKVLDIPQRFGADWAAKGYAVAKGD